MRRGMCGACYKNWLRQQPKSLRTSAHDRFWPKVDKGGPVPEHAPHLGPCWIWTGKARTPKGYGYFSPQGSKHIYVHRWAWEQVNGAIPPGLTIDHLCRNRGCVNTMHMEVVTRGENLRRALRPKPCPYCGRSITPPNLRSHVEARPARRPKRLHGQCPECARIITGAIAGSGLVLLRQHKTRKGDPGWCSRGERVTVAAMLPQPILDGSR